MFVRGLAAMAVVAAFAAPAMAQGQLTEAQEEEAYCVYEGILDSDSFYAIGDDYLLYGDLNTEGGTREAVDAATKECDARYSWTDEKSDMAVALAVLGAASDTLSEDSFFDLSDEAYDGIFECYKDLTDSDLDKLAGATWSDDAALVGRAKEALKKRGFPVDDEGLVFDAILLMEINISHILIVNNWAGMSKS